MIILGTNSIKDTGYDVDNSLRFNSGSSDALTRDITSNGNKKLFTFSFWVKRSALGSEQRILMGDDGGNGEDFFQFNSNDKMKFASADGSQYLLDLDTTRVFRDVSAWYHLVLLYDSAQSTASNRVKIYVNGEQETLTGNFPGQNNDILFWNTSGADIDIGARTKNSNLYFNGYLAEFCFIDGQALAPTDFGEFDEDSGIWKPIDVSGLTFGTNGFYLDFENSGALGADVSGNSNNFTVNNLTAIDQSTDTCTNNNCTWNPLAKYTNTLTFSEGNTKTIMSSQSWHSARGTFGFSSGKWYWECKLLGNQSNYTGVVDESAIMNTADAHTENGNTLFYNGAGGEMEVDGSQTTNNYGNFSESQVCGVAVDADNNKISIYKNGSAIVSNHALSSTRTGFLFPTAASLDASTEIPTGQNTNFGSPPYSESGGNSDGNGYGNFNQAVPSGYFALNTKNLSEYG